MDNVNNCKETIFKDKSSGLYKTFNKLYNNKKNQILLNELIKLQNSKLKTDLDNSVETYLNNTSNINTIKREKGVVRKSLSFCGRNTFFNFGKKKPEKEEGEPPKSDVYYYLISDLLINKKYEKLFDTSQNNYHYSIKELKECKNDEDIIKNDIIKVKNLLSSLLCNYRGATGRQKRD